MGYTILAIWSLVLLLSLAALSFLIWMLVKVSHQLEGRLETQNSRSHSRALWWSSSILTTIALLTGVGFAVTRHRLASQAAQSINARMFSIELGTNNRENGIQLREWKDGQTIPDQIDGLVCRSIVQTPELTSRHIYFAVEDIFKAAEPMDVLIVVDYFDDDPGSLQLQYDAVGNAYASAAPTGELQTGTRTWRKAYFICRNAGFQNLQNGGSDFRVIGNNGTLSIRRVAMLHLAEIFLQKDA